MQCWLCAALAGTVCCDPAAIDPNLPFADYGLDSHAAIGLVGRIEEHPGGGELSATLLWEYPSAASLVAHLEGGNARELIQASPIASAEPIAIVGLACRLPGAAALDGFWDLLHNGRNAIGPSPRLPGIEAGFLPAIKDFDAAFFCLSASEAEAMATQRWLLLAAAWEALEAISSTCAA